jgi:hypothetical protein
VRIKHGVSIKKKEKRKEKKKEKRVTAGEKS